MQVLNPDWVGRCGRVLDGKLKAKVGAPLLAGPYGSRKESPGNADRFHVLCLRAESPAKESKPHAQQTNRLGFWNNRQSDVVEFKHYGALTVFPRGD
jgi:hypothetical protein